MIKVFKNAFVLAHDIFPQGGVCLEFGVYVGTTLAWQAEQIKMRYTKSSLIGFDSWRGLPPETENIWIPERHKAGGYASTKDVVMSKLSQIGMHNDSRVSFVDGFYSESLTTELQKTIGPVIFINVDVDIYSSTIELLNFIKPLLQVGTVLYWDDWKDPRDEREGEWGEHLAWREWSDRNADVAAETIEINPVNQRSMVVVRANGKQMNRQELARIRSMAFATSNDDPTPKEKLKRRVKEMIRYSRLALTGRSNS
jgi:hypothetical protein